MYRYVFFFVLNLAQRLIFIVPAILREDNSSHFLLFYIVDLVLLVHFARSKRYCPGCLYNNLHVLMTGKKLKAIFVSFKSRRFSGTKKCIVGMTSIAALIQVGESISRIWCFFHSDAETPWQKQPAQDVTEIVVTMVGVAMSAHTCLVALVATGVFYGFTVFVYLKFVLSDHKRTPSV